MAWAFGTWQDFLKKKACRFFLNHYLGQFLKEKLSLDQLSLDLYNGTGKISDLNLDVQAINADLKIYGIPVELVDGFVECISITIPWSSLVQDSTQLEVKGLELTLQPKQREDQGMMAGEMFNSMQSSMTTSLQLAKDCLEAEKGDPVHKSEPIEGVQKFANMIDSVLSKIRVTLIDTVVRLEHHPSSSPKGVALELRIKRIEYFDDMATTTDGTSVDGNWEPAAIVQKNFHIDGVQLFFDEISHRKSCSRSRSSSSGSQQSQMFASSRSSVTSTLESEDSQDLGQSAIPSSSLESCPVQVAVVTGRQDVKLRTKQNDTLHGPKLELLCQFGAIHVLLSPWQLHGLVELLAGLNSPGSNEGSGLSGGGLGVKNKPMEDMDFQRVESELQHQLKYGRIQSNNLAQMQDFSLHGEEDDHFFSLMSTKPGSQSDMDSSFSSSISAFSNRTASTAPSSIPYSRGPSKQSKDTYTSPKYHEDPSAELSHFQVRVAFISVTLLHNNPSAQPADDLGRSRSEVMKDVAMVFFQRVAGVTVAGMTELKETRQQFAVLLSLDHLRLIGRPLNIECNQKVAMKQVSTSLHVSVGVAELIETLYTTRSQQPKPKICEILVFRNDETKKSAMYSSMHGGSPCFNLDVKSVFPQKMSSRQSNLPRTDVTVHLGSLQSEIDLTLIDRINTLVTMETIIETNPLAGASMYHTVGTQYYSIAHTLDEGPSSQDQRFQVQVSSPSARLSLRFPIPDLRQEPHVDKSWYQRNLRDDILTIDLEDMRLQTTFTNSQPLEQLQISASEIHGYFKFKYNEEEIHFAHVTGEGGEEGFNNPTFTIRFCTTTNSSVLDEVDMYQDDNPPADSLNGACEFAKTEPSPFSSRRHMYDKEQVSDQSADTTEQMVIPADREEMAEFMQKSVSSTKMVVDIVLPNACVFLPDKHFFEVLYNRLNNDLLLWEPSAPAPMTSTKEMYSIAQNVDLNVYDQLQGLHGPGQFSLAQSGIQYDSDSDSDNESTNHYSIHDSRYPRRKRSPRQQQSKLCLSLNIGKGRLTAFTHAKDTSGVVLPESHGEVLVQLSDFSLFTVSAHNGDPNLQYLNILINRADLYHHPCVLNTELHPLVDCGELAAPVPHHLQSNKAIYRSEAGVMVNTREDIGRGLDTVDMVSVALKIRLDTMASKCDLTTDEKVKEFLVSVGLRGATMRHRTLPPHQHLFLQMMDFLDVKDYPILGYVDPKVLTELHVHLWTCAIDYRPRYLPLKTLLLAESFSITSNIVAESSMSVLRFVLDDGALFLSKKTKAQRTDVRKDYVCVTDIGRLELLLRSYDGRDLRHPKTDLRISTNRINIRTCSDSCIELINLIQYLAADGDLISSDTIKSEVTDELEADVSGTIDGDEECFDQGPASLGQQTLTTSSMDHVHTLMTDAMHESSDSDQSYTEASPEVSQTDRQTEVFFVPDLGQHLPGSPGSSRQPIIITQNIDSVTTSIASAMGDSPDFSGSENSDDFCMIDDTTWGKAPKDGEPTVRVFLNTSVEIKDNFFGKPVGRTDLLKSPDHFPSAEARYTLKELSLVWFIYGGSDFTDIDCYNTGGDRVVVDGNSLTMSYHRGSPTDRWSGQAGGREAPLLPRETLTSRGGPGRDLSKCMELQLTKVRFQYELYPSTADYASRQVLLVSDIEVRDKLKTSKINKFLYHYCNEDMPRQTYTNMLHVKAVHRRPNPAVPEEEECALKVSLQPLRLNIDQDTLFFLKTFIFEVACVETTERTSPKSDPAPPVSRSNSGPTPPPPVMTVNKPGLGEVTPEAQYLLMQFDELTHDLQASLRVSTTSDRSSGLMRSTSSTSSSATVTSETNRPAQPVFFKSFVFAPDVPIRLDYHGKFDREHGTLGGLGGLVSLNHAELKLKHITYKHGLLGTDRLVTYCLNEWLTDIRVNQLPTILGGFGPMHSFVQLAHGLRDLFWLPVEQYRKDGRIVRGLQRGATSFSMSTAMSLLELTNRMVQSVQWCAELTFDMVSPGPRRRGYYPRQPADLREGVTNAYIVLREGFSDTASTIVDAVATEHRTKGMMGAVGGAIRQIPPTIVQPLIIVPEAASNLIGGLRSQLRPEVRKDDEDKWKEEIID